MNNRTEINKYSFWVKEIDQYPGFLDELNPSVYELKKFLDYISKWKQRYFVDDLNPTLLLNPTMTKEEAKSEDYKQLERVEVIIKDWLKQGKTELDQVECDVKQCSPETCTRPKLKNNFYDFQIEKFELQKTYLSTGELKTYISERTKHYLNEMQEISSHRGKNQNANCLYNQMIWLLDYFKNFNELNQMASEKQKPGVKSFSWTGSQAQLEALCQALIDAKYIHHETTKEAFKSIFSGGEVSSLNGVRWIKKNNKGGVNKTALREFLTLLLGKFQEKTVPLCFLDINRKTISLNKPKADEYSTHYKELESIINSLKKLEKPDH